MNLLLSPHHDDAELFASYACLRYRPHVVVCFTGGTRYGATDVRQAETAAAMRILGCEWSALYEQTDRAAYLESLDPARVFAPMPEPDGNAEHNFVGELALDLWPDRVTLYTTYTPSGRTVVGDPVRVEAGWKDLKRRALACYVSQIAHPGTRPHFRRPLDEYLVSADVLQAVA